MSIGFQSTYRSAAENDLYRTQQWARGGLEAQQAAEYAARLAVSALDAARSGDGHCMIAAAQSPWRAADGWEFTPCGVTQRQITAALIVRAGYASTDDMARWVDGESLGHGRHRVYAALERLANGGLTDAEKSASDAVAAEEKSAAKFRAASNPFAALAALKGKS